MLHLSWSSNETCTCESTFREFLYCLFRIPHEDVALWFLWRENNVLHEKKLENCWDIRPVHDVLFAVLFERTCTNCEYKIEPSTMLQKCQCESLKCTICIIVCIAQCIVSQTLRSVLQITVSTKRHHLQGGEGLGKANTLAWNITVQSAGFRKLRENCYIFLVMYISHYRDPRKTPNTCIYSRTYRYHNPVVHQSNKALIQFLN